MKKPDADVLAEIITTQLSEPFIVTADINPERDARNEGFVDGLKWVLAKIKELPVEDATETFFLGYEELKEENEQLRSKIKVLRDRLDAEIKRLDECVVIEDELAEDIDYELHGMSSSACWLKRQLNEIFGEE